uniref:Putative secreted protein n=1 Tax=Anopheles triannulatus TaxID=58253 RepID=A0A2M4B6K6_9DIPT
MATTSCSSFILCSIICANCQRESHNSLRTFPGYRNGRGGIKNQYARSAVSTDRSSSASVRSVDRMCLYWQKGLPLRLSLRINRESNRI